MSKTIDTSPEAVGAVETPLEKARGFASYCRSSAFERGDGPLIASAFDFFADLLEAMHENDGQILSAVEYAGFARSTWIVDALKQKADELENVSAALSEARGRVGEAERERDEAQDAIRREVTAANLQFFSRKTDELGAALLKAEAERDAALSELAKLRGEAEWRPISEAPMDGTKVLVALREFNDPANPYISCFATFENGSWIEEGEPIYRPDYFFALPSPPKDPAHD